jgi:hypothetical protein
MVDRAAWPGSAELQTRCNKINNLQRILQALA